jgi:hypothetical protein
MFKVEQTERGDWAVINTDPMRDHVFWYPTKREALAAQKRWNAIAQQYSPTYQQRVREAAPDHADEAVAMADAFLNANPDCAF